MNELKPGEKVVFTKEFDDYFVLQSLCGYAVLPIQPGTSGGVQEIFDNYLIIKLNEPLNPRTIIARTPKERNILEYLKIL